MEYAQTGPTVIHEDNQEAIKYSQTREAYGRMKHINVKHLFIRDAITVKLATLQVIRSSDNRADILTKAIAPKVFQKHRISLGVQEYQTGGVC